MTEYEPAPESKQTTSALGQFITFKSDRLEAKSKICEKITHSKPQAASRKPQAILVNHFHLERLMGFFDSLAKAASSAGASIKKANIDKIEKLWKDMDRVSTSRLADVCKERGFDDMAGCLAFLKLQQKGSQHSVSLNSDEMESVRDKAAFIKRTIELSEGRTFSEIRGTINSL